MRVMVIVATKPVIKLLVLSPLELTSRLFTLFKTEIKPDNKISNFFV